MGCANCKSNSCSGTCGGEVSKFATSELKFDGARFICRDDQQNILFQIDPCMTGNEVLEILFEKLCEGLQLGAGAIVNVGTGEQWYKGLNGGINEFRTLIVEPGFTATQNANDITLGINFISSDASVTITPSGNDIDLVAVNQGGVINVGAGSGEIYSGLSGGNHEMRTIRQSKWISVSTVGPDVEIFGKRIGHRQTVFDGGICERFLLNEQDLDFVNQINITDTGSELSITPVNEYLALVTAKIELTVNMTGTDNNHLVFKLVFPDDIKLNTGGATQITNNYLQNNISTAYYDFQLYDPDNQILDRYKNKNVCEAIAFYDDGLGGTEEFPTGQLAGNVLALRYIGYPGVAGLYYLSARVTIPVKLNSDWDYLETISTNYVRNW